MQCSNYIAREKYSGSSLARNSLCRILALGAEGEVRHFFLEVALGKQYSIFGLQGRGNKYTTRALHFSILFSTRHVTGMIKTIREKYRMDAICPMLMKGFSTGCPPIHVRVSKSATRTQNKSWLRGRNIMVCCLLG